MKLMVFLHQLPYRCVASLAEAWIEICEPVFYEQTGWVASLAEAWIEIPHEVANLVEQVSPPSRRRGLKSINESLVKHPDKSPPSRRRGLKFFYSLSVIPPINVASLAEAWIEILRSTRGRSQRSCRLPRGGVD